VSLSAMMLCGSETKTLRHQLMGLCLW